MESDVQVIGLLVMGICSDGKVRRFALTGKQPKQVLGYVKHIQGGTLRLEAKPAGEKAEQTNEPAMQEG